MDEKEALEIARLIHAQRWASLATLHDGQPHASMVAYCPAADTSHFLLHLSRLAPHTRYLLDNRQVSLAISEQDDGREDPQTLARLSVEGIIEEIARGSPEYIAGKAIYLDRIPASAPLFDFGDFSLFRFLPTKMRYVGGFARARNLSPVDLLRLINSVVA